MSAKLKEWALAERDSYDELDHIMKETELDASYAKELWEIELEEEWQMMKDIAMSEWSSIIDFTQYGEEVLYS